MLVIICVKYGKKPARIVDFSFKVKAEKFQNLPKFEISRFWKKSNTQHTF